MSWQDFVLNLVQQLGVGGIFGAVLGSVITLIVQAHLDRKHEAQRRIDEHRVEVLSSVYAALYDMHIALEHYATPDAEGDEAARRADVFREAANAFCTEWERGRLWFDNDMRSLLDDIWKHYKDASYALDDAGSGIEFAQNRKDARSLLNTKIPEAWQALDQRIRAIIGVRS